MGAPSLTTWPSGGRVERIDVAFDGFPNDVARFDLYRLSDGRMWQVRGGVKVPVSTATISDEEAPFGVLSEYRAEQFDAAGNSMGFSGSASAVLDVDAVRIQQPLDPDRSLWLRVRDLEFGTADKLQRVAPTSLTWPEGAALPRPISSVRRGVSGLNFSFFTWTLEDAAKVDAMLGSEEDPQLPVLCIRTPPINRMPRTLFLDCSKLVQEDVDLFNGGQGVRWSTTATESMPPLPGLTTPIVGYSDLDFAYSSYAARDAAFGTYSAMDTAWSLAGIAGD